MIAKRVNFLRARHLAETWASVVEAQPNPQQFETVAKSLVAQIYKRNHLAVAAYVFQNKIERAIRLALRKAESRPFNTR